MRSSLSMRNPANRDRSEFRRVILVAEFRRGQQQSQNLRIGGGGPAGDAVEQQEHQQTTQKTAEQVERSCANAHGEEKQLPFRSQDGEWPGHRAMHRMDSSWVRHGVRSFLRGAKTM